MASLHEILVIISGDSGPFVASLDKARGSMASASDSAAAFNKSIIALGAAAAVGIGAFAVKSVQMATDFQKQLTMIHTQAGQQTQNLAQVGSQLLTMAPQVGASATDLATAYYHFASANIQVHKGLTETQADLDATRASAELAKIGNTDYESSAQAVVAVLSAYPQYAGNAGAAAAQLNAIVGAGDMRMSQLTAAMSTGLLPAFATAKLTVTDAGAALATITDNATPANEAATRLRMTVALLQHQSQPAADALASIGIKSGQLGEDMVKPNGLLVAVTDLKDHLTKTFGPEATAQTNEYLSILKNKGVDAASQYAKSVHGAAEVINDAFGGGKTSAAIQTLLGEYDKFKGKYADIEKGTKDFQQDWQETQQTFSFRIDSMKAGLGSLMIRFGEALLPMAGQLVGWATQHVFPVLQKVADWLLQNGVPAIQKFGDWLGKNIPPAFAAVAAVINGVVIPAFHVILPILHDLLTVLGFIISHVGGFRTVLIAVIGPLAAVKAAMIVQGEVQLAVKAFNGWLGAVQKVGGALIGLPGKVAGIGKSIASMADTAYLKFLYLKEGVGKVINSVVEFGEKAWVTAQSWATAIASTIADFARAAAAAATNAAKTAVSWAKSAASAVADFASMAAGAALNAAKTAATWIAQTATFLAQQGIRLASWLATNAVMLGSAIATGVAAAAAFLLPLLPIILIGAAVIALVALFVLNFNRIKDFVLRIVGDIIGWIQQNWQTLIVIFTGPIGLVIDYIVNNFNRIRTFLGNIWRSIQGDAAQAWNFLWSNVIRPVLNFIIGGINELTGGINAFLGMGESVLSRIPGLGGLSGKLIPKIPMLAGGGAVTATGLALVHAGEVVLNPAQATAIQSGAGGGTTIGAVNVYNPASNVDVTTAINQQQWLARMQSRGVTPLDWPISMAPA
jgi:TP901 family phage tail tape measure protein